MPLNQPPPSRDPKVLRALGLAAFAVATVPVLDWAAGVWIDGTLGGAGAGLIALPVAGFLAVLARNRPAVPSGWPDAGADACRLAAAALYVAGAVLSRVDRNAWHLAGVALPLWAFGHLWSARGAPVARRFSFPLGFTLFALPWELFLRELDAPLQIASARLGVGLLTLCGFELQWWNEYTFWNDSYYLVINETCSGMNMLMTLTMYGLVFGWVTLRTLSQRATFLLAVAPLALGANGVRVAVIWYLGHVGGDSLAMGFWHTGSAYVIFFPIFWLMALWGRALRHLLPGRRLEKAPPEG